MKKVIFAITVMLLQGCLNEQSNLYSSKSAGFVDYADRYVGMKETTHRKELKSFIKIDPVQYEWCAAFVNAVLISNKIPGSGNFNRNPLLAKSFLDWGEKVEKPQRGDIVVFNRGNVAWQGHVGFFVTSFSENGHEYYLILGGNQNDSVSYETFRSERAISMRRLSYATSSSSLKK